MSVHNTLRRASRAGGLVGLFRTQRQNVQDQIDALNAEGYEVTFIVPDQWTILQWIGSLLLLVLTLSLYTRAPGLLILGVKRY